MIEKGQHFVFKYSPLPVMITLARDVRVSPMAFVHVCTLGVDDDLVQAKLLLLLQ